MSKTIDLASAVSSITSAIVSSRTKEPSWAVSVMKASLTRGPVGAGACSLREVERVDHVLGVLGIDALGQGDQALRIGVADARKHARAGVLALRDLRAASTLVEDGAVAVTAVPPLDGGVLLAVLAHERAGAAGAAVHGRDAGPGARVAVAVVVRVQPRGARRVGHVPGGRAPRSVLRVHHFWAGRAPAPPATPALPVYWGCS